MPACLVPPVSDHPAWLQDHASRYLEQHDEVADLDIMIKAIADELVPELVSRTAVGYESAAQLLITAGTIGAAAKPPWRAFSAP